MSAGSLGQRVSRLNDSVDLVDRGAPANDHRQSYSPSKFRLQSRRKKPLHPDAIEDLLRQKAHTSLPGSGWSWPYGWLLILWDLTGTKHYYDLPPAMGYSDAAAERDKEMATGDYEKAWLIQKTARKEK